MKDLEKGCCGHPVQCDRTTAHGRCKLREEFEQANQPMTFDDKLRAALGIEYIEDLRRRTSEQTRYERKQERGGRELTR